MSTFDPKKKKGFAGEDRRGDRFGNYSRRDDSRSFDHDGDPSPFVKDKRPRISRPARDVRSGSDGPFGDGGKRHSFNPNFTKDNRRRDEFPREKSYRRFDRGERSWNRKMSPRNAPTIGMNGTTGRRGAQTVRCRLPFFLARRPSADRGEVMEPGQSSRQGRPVSVPGRIPRYAWRQALRTEKAGSRTFAS